MDKYRIRERAISYIILFVSLCILYPVVSSFSWQGSAQLHTAMEIFSTIIALSIGIFALRLYFKINHYTLLIIGTGFIGTAFLDGYHATVTSVLIKDLLPSDLPSLIPWSWIASRLYLSVVFFVSWVSWNNRRQIGPAVEIGRNVIFITSAILTLLCSLFFIFTPLPRAYYPELFFHRPEEFLPALFFTLALIGYLKKGRWKTNKFEHWLIITLIINVASQVLYMSLSGSLFDIEFDIAHTLKVISYVTLFIGLHSYASEADNTSTYINNTLTPKVQIEPNRVKQSIARNMVVLIAGLVIISIGLITIIVQNQFTQSMVERGREQLRNETARSMLIFNNIIGQLEDDTLYLANTPPIQGIIRATQNNGIDPVDNSTIEQWRARLEILFSQMIKHKKDDTYLSIRLIGIRDNGRELVRVDRTGKSIQVIPEKKLQEKGNRDYVKETIKLAKNEVFYSDINLNREYEKIAEPHVPVLRLSVPVFSDAGKMFGMVIINKGMRTSFKTISNLSNNDHDLYVTNAQGAFLVHPEKKHEFNFESGGKYNIHDEFPGLINETNINSHQAIVQKNNSHDRLIANYLRVPLGNNNNYLGFIVSNKYENIITSTYYNNYQTFLLATIIICFALVIGWIFSHTITAPLKFITETVIGYTKGIPVSRLPINAKGEIGVLARSFNNLIYDITKHTELLESEINERKDAEQIIKKYTKNLEQTKDNLSNILKNAVDPIISINEKGLIQAFNPAAEKMFGYNLDEVIDKNIKMLMPSPFHEEHDGYLSNYRTTGKKKIIGIGREVKGKRKDGSIFPMDLSVSEVSLGGNRSFTGIVRDISERKKSEKELINAKEQAEVANKSKSEFLATMSHEIRTPMNGVLGMSHILLDTDLNDEQRDYVDNIQSSGNALLTIINDILDFSKIEAGKLEIEPIPFDLKSTLFEIIELLNITVENKNLEVILYFPSNVHPTVIGDPGRIRQVLMNLASNAIKFTETGHVYISAKNISANDDKLTIRFSVEDTGPGIPQAAQEKLFSAFTQADASTTRKYGGTGLGLTICKQLVELMGGTIGVESESGKGSTFWFELTLPLVDRKVESLKSTPVNIKQKRILVVDDNQINRNIFTEYLHSWDINSDTTDSGAAAIELLKEATERKKPFDIVLTDYNMPEMDGEQLAKTILDNPDIDTPVMALLTSSGSRGDGKRFSKAGFSAYLVKPIDPSTLLDALIMLDESNFNDTTPKIITQHTIKESKYRIKEDNRYLSSSKSLRVLLAEDNLVNQMVAKKLLQKLNCTVDIASNGKEAVDMTKKFSYDLIFMDCQMPEMDGYEATGIIQEYFKETNIKTPIIALTANAIKGDKDKCLASGMNDYLSKPISQDKLHDMIKHWIHSQTQDVAV
jgi:PAS domain S-box-containing protein